jgi:hypothetical protein
MVNISKIFILILSCGKLWNNTIQLIKRAIKQKYKIWTMFTSFIGSK